MIKVNKEVAKRLRGAETNNGDSSVYRVYKLLKGLQDDTKTLQIWFDENNITLADIEKAFTEGFEEIYEFKVGDILISRSGMLYNVTETGRETASISLRALRDYMENGNKFKLLCKAEDRLDLKEGE